MAEAITFGQVVRVQDWPGTRGERFLVVGLTDTAKGLYADLMEFDGGTPWRQRTIPAANLVVDIKATRERERRIAAQQSR